MLIKHKQNELFYLEIFLFASRPSGCPSSFIWLGFFRATKSPGKHLRRNSKNRADADTTVGG